VEKAWRGGEKKERSVKLEIVDPSFCAMFGYYEAELHKRRGEGREKKEKKKKEDRSKKNSDFFGMMDACCGDREGRGEKEKKKKKTPLKPRSGACVTLTVRLMSHYDRTSSNHPELMTHRTAGGRPLRAEFEGGKGGEK